MKNIDFHSHILPGIDHGCPDMLTGEQQLALMRENEIDIAVATSHFYPEAHDAATFLAATENVIHDLRDKVGASAPALALGAEVLICPNLHQMPHFRELCIRGTNIMLIELPMSGCSDGIIETLEIIRDMGITVVLAHIDRYLPEFQNAIDYLLREGFLAQMNAMSLSHGAFRKKLMPYLMSDRIVAFGSDLHSADTKVYKAFRKLIKLPDDIFTTVMERSTALLQDAQLF